MRKPAKRKHSISLSMIFLPLVLLVFGSINASSSNPEKMKPEELVAKHLESIAPAQALARIKTRIIAGTSQVIFRTNPEGQASGRAVLASEGSKNLLGMSFPTPVYPREQLVFDGGNFVAAFVTPGVRSVLGNFLMTNQAIFKQGLMGGTLSCAWPLLDAASKGAQLEYAGTRNVDNKVLHVLKYVPRGGSDVKITLLFDQDSFQHVRTEYERVIPAQMDTRSYTNVQTRESRYKMIEEFSSFKKEGELTLPHTYKIRLEVDTQGGTFLADWTINLTQFTFNEKIDPAAFNSSAN